MILYQQKNRTPTCTSHIKQPNEAGSKLSYSTCEGYEAMDEEKKSRQERREILPLYLLEFSMSIVIILTILYGGYYYCNSIPVPRSNDFGEKFLYTLRYCTFPQAVFLMFSILRVGSKRGSTPAMNPLAGKEDYVQVEKNILTNTMEQLISFLLLMLALTTYLEPMEMRFIPLCSLAFIVGRVLFLIGYTISPKYRSVGMSINFLLSFFCAGYVFYLIYLRGFAYGILPGHSASKSTASSATGKAEL